MTDTYTLSKTLTKLLPFLAPHLVSLICVIFGTAQMDVLIPLFICTWPSLTSLTLRLTVANLPSLAPSARDSRMTRLQHLTYAIPREVMDWTAFLSTLLSACPSLVLLDLADLARHTSLLAILILSGWDADVPLLLSSLGRIGGAVLAKRLGKQLRTNGSALQAFRPGMGVRVRLEASFERWTLMRFAAEEDRRTLAAGTGHSAWIAEPGWLF